MIAADVVSLYRTLEEQSILIWIDGGWAVDALLAEQTRTHDDLDVVVQTADLPALQTLLEEIGYSPVQRDDTSPWNFVLGDTFGRLVDVHVISLNADGSGQYGPVQTDMAYPAGSLDGAGLINGQAVRCIAPAHLVAFHTGYNPRATDLHDVTRLCARFGIPLPDVYRGMTAIDPQLAVDPSLRELTPGAQ